MCSVTSRAELEPHGLVQLSSSTGDGTVPKQLHQASNRNTKGGGEPSIEQKMSNGKFKEKHFDRTNMLESYDTLERTSW